MTHDVTLKELLEEIGYAEDPDHYACHFCRENTRWEIGELSPAEFRLKCACGKGFSSGQRS